MQNQVDSQQRTSPHTVAQSLYDCYYYVLSDDCINVLIIGIQQCIIVIFENRDQGWCTICRKMKL